MRTTLLLFALIAVSFGAGLALNQHLRPPRIASDVGIFVAGEDSVIRDATLRLPAGMFAVVKAPETGSLTIENMLITTYEPQETEQ